MDTKIYYYSATGNSFHMARELANGLGGAELISIPKTTGAVSVGNAARVGFVFPVIGWGVPLIVTDFIRRLNLDGNPYVFAVATCGGTQGPALKELRKLLRKAGADLHAGFACKEGANTVLTDPGLVTAMRRMNRSVPLAGKERLPDILSAIRDKQTRKAETSSFIVNLIGGLMHSMMTKAADKFKAADANYSVDDHCAGCRTCERVCPQGNITLEGGKPAWHHNCMMCNACIQWCPREAIHVPNETCRYRNPAVRADDLMLR